MCWLTRWWTWSRVISVLVLGLITNCFCRGKDSSGVRIHKLFLTWRIHKHDTCTAFLNWPLPSFLSKDMFVGGNLSP
jgi:hypothetical protein